MNILKNRGILFLGLGLPLAIVSSIWLTERAGAAIPLLTLTHSGSQGFNTVQVTVQGDRLSEVGFYYYNESGQKSAIGTLGWTDANGYFSRQVNGTLYGIKPGMYVYAVVNNQQSPLLAWPAAPGTAVGSYPYPSGQTFPGGNLNYFTPTYSSVSQTYYYPTQYSNYGGQYAPLTQNQPYYGYGYAYGNTQPVQQSSYYYYQPAYEWQYYQYQPPRMDTQYTRVEYREPQISAVGCKSGTALYCAEW